MSTGGFGQWFWYSDSGWVPFSDSLNTDIERGYKAKTARVKVDNERFVDLQQLLQRRYDDENKCRMVKREIKPSFDGCVVFLIGGFSRPDNDLIKLISDNGGLVAQFITHHVTIALCGTNPALSDLAEAHQLGIPVVTDDIVDDVVQNGFKNVDVKRFTVPVKAVAPLAPPNEPHCIEKGTKWSGVFTDSAGKMVPLELVVTMRHRLSGAFAGELKRPTWKNMKTRVRGTLQGANLKLEELALVSGGVSGKLPSFPVVFEGSLVDKQMKLTSMSDGACTLELTLLPAARGSTKTPLQMLAAGSAFEGSLTQISPISIEFHTGPLSVEGSLTLDGNAFPLSNVAETTNVVTFSHDMDGVQAIYTLTAHADGIRGTKTEGDVTANVKIDL
eukprot:TRINITY_DN15946_c0_g1_i2.p1 TRINITY_DN15946_c0_g1~~TRINITY_DN15946_c0_g1_i2.p1  ORF type:complete len:388 (+),score=37.31 TRINITY_DN15946_c0_g1_i2:27-1190(+)